MMSKYYYSHSYRIKQFPDGYYLEQLCRVLPKPKKSFFGFYYMDIGYFGYDRWETKSIFKTLKEAKKEKERLLIQVGRIVG